MLINKRTLCPAISLMGLLIAPLTAQAVGENQLRMTATIIANTCTVSTGSINKPVDMGRWATKQFAVSPSGTPVLFTINLENCGADVSGVTVTFTGVADSTDGTLLAISGPDSATNIAIAILDNQRTRIPLGQPSPLYNLTPNSSTEALKFYGQYIATAAAVTPGKANADTIFTLNYE